jgi:hypothetical protein
MARSDILRGPAIIQYEGATFYSQADIAVEIVGEHFGIQTSHWGEVDQRDNAAMHRLSFIPVGRWANLSILYPYATSLIGSSVFGTDKTLTIWARDGKKRVYKAAAVTRMPNCMFASTKTLFAEVQFTCLHADAMDWEDPNSLFTDSEEAYPGDTGFSVADIITQPYALSWGAAFTVAATAATDLLAAASHKMPYGTRLRFTTTDTLPAGLALATDYYMVSVNANDFKVSLTPGGAAVDITDAGTGVHTATPVAWADFRSKDGVTLEFNLQLTPEDNDHKGIFDYTFQSLTVVAKLQPEGPLPSDILAALVQQGPGAKRGRSLGTNAADLNIVGSGVYGRVYNAALVNPREAYGASARRVGPLEFRATRSITAGTADPLFFLGTSAPA